MKSVNIVMAVFSPRNWLPETALFTLFAFLNLIAGCSYYRVKPVQSDALRTEAQSPARYVILHQGASAWHLKSLVFDQAKNELSGIPELVSPEHLSYPGSGDKTANRYRSGESRPGNELHIFTREYLESGDSVVFVPLASVYKVETCNTDIPRSVIAAFGGTLLSIIITFIMIAAVKSSCPFLYAYDGASYNFTGEMYSGAICAPLERDDYMPVPGLCPLGNEYKLRISNELLERQFTNLAELIVVQHNPNSGMLLDRYGTPHSFRAPRAPVSAVSDAGYDYRDDLQLKDSIVYFFNDQKSNPYDQNALTLAFGRPAGATHGKLILRAKNTLWLDYMFEKFNALAGRDYGRISEKRANMSAERLSRWSLDQGLPLAVYLETANGWKYIDCFPVVGPLAARDLIMPVNLAETAGESVRVRLSCGLMFWEVDYAAMDFSDNEPVSKAFVTALTAKDENGLDVKPLLASADREYLSQPLIGNSVELTFPAAAFTSEQVPAVFLHSRGYYEPIRNYRGKPDLDYFKTFREKGAFIAFSHDEYNKALKDINYIVNQ